MTPATYDPQRMTKANFWECLADTETPRVEHIGVDGLGDSLSRVPPAEYVEQSIDFHKQQSLRTDVKRALQKLADGTLRVVQGSETEDGMFMITWYAPQYVLPVRMTLFKRAEGVNQTFRKVENELENFNGFCRIKRINRETSSVRELGDTGVRHPVQSLGTQEFQWLQFNAEELQ